MLSLVLLAGGCAPKGAPNDGQVTPMGRYVETDITPQTEDFLLDYPVLVAPHPDGSVDYIASTFYPDGREVNADNACVHFRSGDGGQTWERMETPWLKEIARLCGLDIAVPAAMDMREGTFYCAIYDEENHPRLFLVTEDGTVSKQVIPEWEGITSLYFNRLHVTEGGRIGVECNGSFAGAALYYEATGKVYMENYDIWPEAIAFADDTIYGYDGERLVIQRAREPEEKLELPRRAGEMTFEAVDGDFYMISMEGVDRLGENMALFENVMKGSYYSYGDPGCSIHDFRYEPETDVFCVAAVIDNGANVVEKLYRYTFDASIPLLSGERLSICSLEDSSVVRRAVQEFQRQRPDLEIRYVSGWNDGISPEDAAAAMEKQIAQGQGADVVLLDNLDAEKLIDQGLFLPLLPPEGCFDNILAAFQRGDRLMALPARFDASVPCTATVGEKRWEGVIDGFTRYQHAPAGVPSSDEFMPLAIAAVSASCENPETARAFVSALYSETVQQNHYRFPEGFPVLKTAFLEWASLQVMDAIQEEGGRVRPGMVITVDPEILERCAALTKMAPVSEAPPEPGKEEKNEDPVD